MKTKNLIGLKQNKVEQLTKSLNHLLADYQILYMNVRGFHWNIKGSDFFELHLKFEEMYTDLLVKVDEIAERILTLGAVPAHAYSDYLKLSALKEIKNSSDGQKSLKQLVDAFQVIIAKQRALLNLSGEANDEGTNALMSDYIREQEKLIWMFASYLNIKINAKK